MMSFMVESTFAEKSQFLSLTLTQKTSAQFLKHPLLYGFV